MKSKSYPYILAAITILLWGTLSTMYKALINELDAMYVLSASSIISVAVLFVYNLIKGNFKHIKEVTCADWIKMILLGLLGFFFYNWIYMKGIEDLPSAQAMIINYLWPSMIIIFSCVFNKEKFTGLKLLAIVLSIVGAAVVAINGDFSALMSSNLKGVLCCLMAAVSYGLYAALNKKQTYHKEIAMFMAYFVTAIASTIFVCVNGKFTFVSGPTLYGILYNGILVSALAYSTWMMALEKGNTAIISNLAYLSPFLSLLCAKVVLKESISIYSVVGLVIIIVGIFIQIIGESRRNS